MLEAEFMTFIDSTILHICEMNKIKYRIKFQLQAHLIFVYCNLLINFQMIKAQFNFIKFNVDWLNYWWVAVWIYESSSPPEHHYLHHFVETNRLKPVVTKFAIFACSMLNKFVPSSGILIMLCTYFSFQLSVALCFDL